MNHKVAAMLLNSELPSCGVKHVPTIYFSPRIAKL